jgi:hypothetical protein
MLELAMALGLIVVLYWRTLSYKNLIDDIVPMKNYLYVVPQTSPAPDFHLQKPPIQNRILAIAMHCLNTCMVYLLLGSKAALLFSVYPVAVNNVAWITGSYYSITTFLTLAAYYFITKTTWFIGIPLAMAFFAAALNSTVVSIAFPFVFLFGNPLGLTMLVPLAIFLTGKRFTVGKKIREGDGVAIPSKVFPDVFNLGRIAVMTKVVARYLYIALVPLKLCFFHRFGEEYRFDAKVKKDLESFNTHFFASIGLIGCFILVGFLLGKLFWAMWFLVFIAAFSQYKLLGQFFAERYLYPASIGIIALLSMLPDQVYWVLVGLYIMRTHMFIPVFTDNGHLYHNGIEVDATEPTNYCNLSDWYMMVVKKLDLAGHYIQANIAIDSRDYKPHVNFASLWRMLGNYEQAVVQGKLAIEKATGYAYPHTMKIMEQQLALSEKLLKERNEKK